jgi:uncharacterized damage-inducible protein DinB
MGCNATTVRDLLLYMLWADRLILAAVRQVPPADLNREAGVSFGSLLGTMAHMLASQRLWLSRFLGNPLGRIPSRDETPDLPSWIAEWEETASQIEAFVAGLSDDQLASPLTWKSIPDGEEHTLPLWQPVVHLVNHNTYHRGQVVSLLRQMGYEPPGTDLVHFFLR